MTHGDLDIVLTTNLPDNARDLKKIYNLSNALELFKHYKKELYLALTEDTLKDILASLKTYGKHYLYGWETLRTPATQQGLNFTVTSRVDSKVHLRCWAVEMDKVLKVENTRDKTSNGFASGCVASRRITTSQAAWK
ncbi:MAG: hypothetical protein Q9170_007114 [Blastenia crenularia]